MKDCRFTFVMKGVQLARVLRALKQSSIKSRIEFIRYLIDQGLDTWERQNDAP